MTSKHIVVALAIACLISPALSAQKKKAKVAEPEGYQFTTDTLITNTSIKDQASSGTCWAYSALSFFEAEILKAGYTDSLDLAEMFIVHNTYRERAEKFVRLHGKLNFGAGSSFGNVLYGLKKWGIVPQWEMEGLNYGTDRNIHGEMDAILDAYVNAVIKAPNGKLTPVWQEGYVGVLDSYLGETPETFTVNGTEYTPHTYMESLGLNLDDYVDITSWTHQPFYQKMIIEVPDNWLWEESYNVPIDDMIAIIDNALENGYSLAWAADVSERGFTRDGLGIVPDYDALQISLSETGTDQARWIGAAGRNELYKKAFDAPCPELEITQEMRQEGYDNYQTTDDHGMHLIGKAHDQNGKKYYIIKNSWGKAGKYEGIWYISEAFVRYKTMDILINKNAIPADIRAKLGL